MMGSGEKFQKSRREPVEISTKRADREILKVEVVTGCDQTITQNKNFFVGPKKSDESIYKPSFVPLTR
jgi:hypothetical protein